MATDLFAKPSFPLLVPTPVLSAADQARFVWLILNDRLRTRQARADALAASYLASYWLGPARTWVCCSEKETLHRSFAGTVTRG